MLSLLRKVMILFSLLFFLLAGVSPVPSTVFHSFSAADQLSTALNEVELDSQTMAVSGAEDKASTASHERAPALKQRPSISS